MDFEIRSLSGHHILPFIRELARLRIEVFREYPYLYDGSAEYEENYLKSYTDCEDSLVVFAFRDGKIVGASTGIPMEDAAAEFQEPFIRKGYDPKGIFYFGESVLLRQYRGQGLYLRFFEERESYAEKLNRFHMITFCAVDRPARHPLRPSAYAPLDRYWEKRGYRKQSDMQCLFPWKDTDEESESLKSMIFWIKSLKLAD